MKSSRTPLLVPALPPLPSLFLFTRRPCQILFMLPLQPLVQLLVALLLLLSLLSALPSFPPRRRRRQSLSFSVLFIEILLSNAIGPVPKVFLVVINGKKIIRCETNTAVLSSSEKSLHEIQLKDEFKVTIIYSKGFTELVLAFTKQLLQPLLLRICFSRAAHVFCSL